MSPYWALYLKERSFSAEQIGVIAAVPFLTKLFAPNLWSWYSDRFAKGLLVMRLGSFSATLILVGILLTTEYVTLIFLMALYGFFWNAILPQIESATLMHLGERSTDYSKIRVWGSVGFICTVLALGALFEIRSVIMLPAIVLCISLIVFAATLTLPNINHLTSKTSDIDFIGLVFRPHVLIFFLVLFFLQFSHGVYYVFYSIYLEDFAYSKFVIGILWTVGVLSEIVVFLKMPHLFARFSLYHLLSISLLLTTIRWILIGFFPLKITFLVVAQLLHAFSFGVVHAVAIEFVRRQFGRQAQSQGQALYSALSFGAGASLGAYVSGLLWHASPSATFYCASFSAFIGWVLCVVFLRGKL